MSWPDYPASSLLCRLGRLPLFQGLLLAIAATVPGTNALPLGLKAEPGTAGIYRVLPATPGPHPPVESVRIAVHSVTAEPETDSQAITIEILRKDAGGHIGTAVELRLVPGTKDASTWHRYQIWIPGTEEAYDYRNVHTDQALLPAWMRFEEQFLPRPAPGAERDAGFPLTVRFLGHVLSLQRVEKATAGTRPYKILRLDPELLIGTSRTFRDRNGVRKQTFEQNYEFRQWTPPEYEQLIDAGFNTFALIPGIESWLRAQPVFYRRGVPGDAPLDWPVDFYRSNYEGDTMFADEPACVMLRDEAIQTGVLHFSDAAEIVKARAGSAYDRLSARLEAAVKGTGASLGRLTLRQSDLPVWDTRYETAFYQLEAGFAGLVHEGRYHMTRFYESPHSFDDYVEASTGLKRTHTPEEMLRIHYAFLRGAARRFNKDWGTSIYGQADPAIAPVALRLAYDMGARYLWFWTSDHGHHVPWPEQLALARALKEHARDHPRPSIRATRPKVDRLILVPYGIIPVLESPMDRRHHWDLWWIRDLDPAGRNEASQRYRALMRRVFREVHQALDRKESFDIAIDDGHEPLGYGITVRVDNRE